MTKAIEAGANNDDWERIAVERSMDWIDAEAARWAEEVDLTSIIKAMSAIADLSKNGPLSERQKLVDRWESHLSNWCHQVFLEAWLRSHDSYKEYRDRKENEPLAALPPAPVDEVMKLVPAIENELEIIAENIDQDTAMERGQTRSRCGNLLARLRSLTEEKT